MKLPNEVGYGYGPHIDRLLGSGGVSRNTLPSQYTHKSTISILI